MTTSPSNTRALRPTEDDVAHCPFCHSANFRRPMQDAWQKWLIGCADCGAEGPQAETPAEAIEAWNTRVPDSALVEALREARHLLANSRAKSGYCMCGHPVASHSFDARHSPVDSHVYAANALIAKIDTTLSQLNPEAGE